MPELDAPDCMPEPDAPELDMLPELDVPEPDMLPELDASVFDAWLPAHAATANINATVIDRFMGSSRKEGCSSTSEARRQRFGPMAPARRSASTSSSPSLSSPCSTSR